MKLRLLLAVGMLLLANPLAAQEPKRLAPPVEVVTPAASVDGAAEMAKLFGAIRRMRQYLMVTGETAFYIGRRQVKLITYPSHLYLLAEKWIVTYRAAVKRLLALPVSDYLDHPERLLELQEAIRWGKDRAIGEPWYYKKGYRSVKIVLQ